MDGTNIVLSERQPKICFDYQQMLFNIKRKLQIKIKKVFINNQKKDAKFAIYSFVLMFEQDFKGNTLSIPCRSINLIYHLKCNMSNRKETWKNSQGCQCWIQISSETTYQKKEKVVTPHLSFLDMFLVL